MTDKNCAHSMYHVLVQENNMSKQIGTSTGGAPPHIYSLHAYLETESWGSCHISLLLV